MIPSNILTRIFHIAVEGATATCFTIEVNGRQYIVTAQHVLANITGKSTINIFHNKEWKQIGVGLVGHCKNGIDISVLATDIQLSPAFATEFTCGHIVYGQDVFFLGFPYGMKGDIGELNRNFPMPFVKKAIVSWMDIKQDGPNILFLDGHNNFGFSGGPVVCGDPNRHVSKIAAVISGYRHSKEPIYHGDQKLPLEYLENTGIIISYGINHAIDLINENPIGYKLR